MAEPISAIALPDVAATAESSRTKLRLLITAMRPHQWSKNFFVFAPLLFARKMTDPEAVGYSVLAFVVFCCLASGLYIFNDWLDIEEDRAHPEKKNRPLSSGLLPQSAAAFGFLTLIAGGLTLAWFIGLPFFIIAAGYFGLTMAYCVTLKKVLILDCMTIAAGFVLRVVGGAVAIDVNATHWLIVCAFLLALFLAFAKRRQELLTLSTNASGHRKVLGQYSVAFLEQVNTILIGASVVSYALYTVASETIERFGTDALIYGTVFVIYGMFRYLALINQPENGGNPSKMLLKDRPLLLTLAAWSAYNAIVIYRVSALELAEMLF